VTDHDRDKGCDAVFPGAVFPCIYRFHNAGGGSS